MDDLPLELAPDAQTSLVHSPSDAEPLSTLTGSTASLGVSGTTGYADPACVASAAPPTPASDLYSLGATIFECIVGSVPAVAAAKRAGARGLDQDVLEGRAPAPPLADVAQDVPESLARIVDALLAADPAKRPRSAESVAWELERIRREIAGRSRPLPPEERGPFRGLARFDSEDRDVYFGRSIEIAAALEMTRTRGLVALVGPSGSGKSSLARAGLLPAIADGELGGWPKIWDTVVLVPGSDPRAALGDALGAILDDPAASTREPDALVAALADRAQQAGRGVVLLVDQLEELVTLGHDAAKDSVAHARDGESRAWAVSLLARLGTQAIPGVRCVVAARRDLLDGLLALGELGRALTRGTLLVAPLTDAAWEEVLDHALGAYDYALEDAAMREALLTQLRGTSSAMPLVQFALTELWARRDALRKTIPRAALDAIGGIGGALEMHADATLAKVGALGEGAQAIARDVLLALTTAQGTRATRTLADLERRVPGPLTTRVVSALADARLLVGESDGLTLAHEALLTRWDTLRRWIAEAKDDRVRAEELEREAAAWIADARSPDRLLKKRRLRAAEELAKEEPRLVAAGARDFLHAGRRAERRAAIVLAVPVALAALVIAGFALARWDAARIKVSYCGNSVTRWQVQECVEPIREAERAHRGISQRFYTQGGRVVKVERLNSAGELRADDDGYASYAYRYDDAGKLTEIVYADRLGQVELREIFSDELRRRERRDRFGIPKPMGKSDTTVTKVEYDERGFLRASHFLSTYGSPRVDELHAYGYALKADALGFYAWSDALGPDGAPSPTSENIAHASRTFDAVGNQIEQTFLDLENKPAILSAKYSTWRAKYDAWGNEVERSYFDSAGSLTTTRWGYARYEQKFDDRGNRVLLSYFDTEGKLAIAQDGYAGVRSLFDVKGNETELEFFGTSSEPLLTHDGYAKAKLRYDDHGNTIETAYFGLD